MRAVPRWQLAWEQTCHTYDSVSFGGGCLMQKQIEALKQLCLKAGIRDADIAACSAARELLLRLRQLAAQIKKNRERNDTIGTVQVPRAGHFQC